MAAVIIERNLSMFFSSEAKTGAQAITDNGSSFAVPLNTPISIPAGAVSCDLAVISASIWYVSPNISASLNNNIFNFTTTSVPGTYNFVIPDGLYSLAGLGTAIANFCVNNGLPTNLFVLSGDDASQKTIITFLLAGDAINFNVAGSVNAIMGFDPVITTAPSANYNFYSQSQANFNRDNSYLITSDLLSNGIPVNNTANGILVNVPITSSPGSQINYAPNQLTWVDASELIGRPKNNMRFRLTNQDLERVDTFGENWSFTITIKYSLLLTSENVPIPP